MPNDNENEEWSLDRNFSDRRCTEELAYKNQIRTAVLDKYFKNKSNMQI